MLFLALHQFSRDALRVWAMFRRLLRAMLDRSPLGDLGALRNPECVPHLEAAVDKGRSDLTAVAPVGVPPKTAVLLATVLSVVRELTGEALEPTTPLMEAGVDSVTATHLSSQLEEATGVALSPTLVFEQPTPRAIAAHVTAQLGGSAPPPTATAVPSEFGLLQSGRGVGMSGLAGRWPGGRESGGTANATSFTTLKSAPGEPGVPSSTAYTDSAITLGFATPRDNGYTIDKYKVALCAMPDPTLLGACLVDPSIPSPALCPTCARPTPRSLTIARCVCACVCMRARPALWLADLVCQRVDHGLAPHEAAACPSDWSRHQAVPRTRLGESESAATKTTRLSASADKPLPPLLVAARFLLLGCEWG